MKRSIPVTLVLAALVAALMQVTSVFGGRYVTPIDAWCITVNDKIIVEPESGRIHIPETLNTRLKNEGGRCEVFFSSRSRFNLDNSQGEVWLGSTRLTSWNYTLDGQHLIIIYQANNGSNGFQAWLQELSTVTPVPPTATSAPTNTTIPTATPQATATGVPATNTPVPNATATPLPSGTQTPLQTGMVYKKPTGFWCGNESNKLDWEQSQGRISVPLLLLLQLKMSPTKCEVYFNVPTNVLLTNVAGQVWVDGALVSIDAAASKQPLLVRQLTVFYYQAGISNGFELLVNDQVVGRIFFPYVEKAPPPSPTATPTPVPARQAPLSPGNKYVKPTGMWCFDDKPDSQMAWEQPKGLLHVAEPLLTRVKSSATHCEIYFDTETSVIVDNATGEVWGNRQFVGSKMHGRELTGIKQLTIVYKTANDSNGFVVLVNSQTPA